ncbi:hypothetical protein QP157_16395 [Sphingomonas sp. LR61]
MQPPEVPEDARQLRDREVVGRTEPEAPTGRRPREVRVRGGVRREDRPGEAGHRVAVVGEGDATGVAGDEGAGHRGLEPPDVLGDGWLADAEAGSSLREALRLGDGQEGLQQDRIEHGHLVRSCECRAVVRAVVRAVIRHRNGLIATIGVSNGAGPRSFVGVPDPQRRPENPSP